jgi:hypothetical protein
MIVRVEIKHGQVLLRRNRAVRVGDDLGPTSRRCEGRGHGAVAPVGVEVGEAVVLGLGHGAAVWDRLAFGAASGHSIGRGTRISMLEGKGGRRGTYCTIWREGKAETAPRTARRVRVHFILRQ